MLDIPVYQIHKIINVYSRQLRQAKVYEKGKTIKNSMPDDKVTISSKGKRQIINKVADEIINRITNRGLNDETGRMTIAQQNNRSDRKVEFNRGGKPAICFQKDRFRK